MKPVYGPFPRPPKGETPRTPPPERPKRKRSRRGPSGWPMWAEITARAGILLMGAFGVGAVLQYIDAQPEGRKPWGQADLDEPGIHLFTSTHLRALRGNADACLAALDGSDMQFTRAAASTSTTEACHWQAGVRIEQSNVGYASPAPDVASCALAATLYVWEREILQPAAQDHLGSEVVEILHYGTFSCRRVNGAQSGNWSEHAGANAIDVSGFRLADGRVVHVTDWDAGGEKAGFLREVRDGSCQLFTGVLGPDYNAAHHDHFHLDMGSWQMCR